MNGIGNANQTIVMADQIPILTNLISYDLRMFIDIITSRAIDNNTALQRIDRLCRNLITLKLLISPITMRADGTPVTYEENQSWFNYENIPVVEVLQHLLAQTSNSGQDSASIINSATALIEMKINFSDQHCFEEIILKIHEMVETIPEYILATAVHQKSIVENLLDRIKRVNKLIYDRIVQSNPTTVNDFNRCLLQVESDATNCAKEHKTLIGSTHSPSHNPASTKKQKMSTSHYRTAVLGPSVAKVCNGCRPQSRTS